MKKRMLALLLAGMMTVGMLSGCGSGSGDSGSQGGRLAAGLAIRLYPMKKSMC